MIYNAKINNNKIKMSFEKSHFVMVNIKDEPIYEEETLKETVEVEIELDPASYFKQEHDADEEDSCPNVVIKEEITVEPEMLSKPIPSTVEPYNGYGYPVLELPAQYKCETCNHSFNVESELMQHRKSHEEASTSSDTVPENEIRNKIPNYKYNTLTCGNCGNKYKKIATFTKHLNKKCEFKSVTCACGVCNGVFYKLIDLKEHLNSISKSYTCDVCNKIFNLKSSYARHMYCHKKRKKLTCDECKQIFTQKLDLECHLRHHKQRKIYSYECKICKIPFERISHLKAHKEIHKRKFKILHPLLYK